VLGLGSGILDGGMNIHFAANFGPRQMNWLHACFGIGATLAPLAMTAILRAGSSWRWGYGLAMLFYALLAVLFALTRTRWHLPLASGSVEGGAHAAVGQTLKLPLVWLGIGLFLILTGLEVCAGQWAAPLFTEARGVRQEIAGLWVGVYWGSFTVGRILFGTLVAWVRPAVMIRFGLAGMAAGLGVGILPGVMGVLAKRHGLEVVPWLLLGLTGVMAVLYEAIRSQRLGAPSPAVTPAD
jgi:fucose permease